MRKPTIRLPLAAAAAWRDAAQLLVLLSLLALAMQGLGAALSVPAVSPAAAVAPSPVLRGLSTAGLHALRPGIAPQAQLAPQPTAGSLRRDGEQGWWIHPGTLTRAELAASLAEASGSRLRGDLLQPEARLPEQALRLPSSEAAWRWLLDARQGYALRCAGLRCELWLTTAGAQPAAAAAPAPVPADPPGLFPAEPPPEPN